MYTGPQKGHNMYRSQKGHLKIISNFSNQISRAERSDATRRGERLYTLLRACYTLSYRHCWCCCTPCSAISTEP